MSRIWGTTASDRVVVLGTVRGRAQRAFDIPFVHVMTFRGGKIVHFKEYFEPGAFLAPEPACKPPPGGWPKPF